MCIYGTFQDRLNCIKTWLNAFSVNTLAPEGCTGRVYSILSYLALVYKKTLNSRYPIDLQIYIQTERRNPADANTPMWMQ